MELTLLRAQGPAFCLYLSLLSDGKCAVSHIEHEFGCFQAVWTKQVSCSLLNTRIYPAFSGDPNFPWDPLQSAGTVSLLQLLSLGSVAILTLGVLVMSSSELSKGHLSISLQAGK